MSATVEQSLYPSPAPLRIFRPGYPQLLSESIRTVCSHCLTLSQLSNTLGIVGATCEASNDINLNRNLWLKCLRVSFANLSICWAVGGKEKQQNKLSPNDLNYFNWYNVVRWLFCFLCKFTQHSLNKLYRLSRLCVLHILFSFFLHALCTHLMAP